MDVIEWLLEFIWDRIKDLASDRMREESGEIVESVCKQVRLSFRSTVGRITDRT